MFNPVARLKSGGYIVIGITEALVAIDVNSGKSTKEGSVEETALKTNLEAAREVAKQLRLRDIGGIIVVDFIDLRSDKNRKKIYDELKKEFKKDPAKTNVIGMSDFGLVQITRQRIRPSVVNSVSKVCPTCGGSGNVVTKNTIIADLDAWLSKFRTTTEYRAVDIYINPYLKAYLEKGLLSIRRKWMFRYWLKITLVGDDTISLNEYKATIAGSDIDITDVVMQEKDVEELIQSESQEAGGSNGQDLDVYRKDRDDRDERDDRKPRPSPSKSGSKSKSKYYK